MDVISSGHLSKMKEWTFDSAKEALQNKRFRTLVSALDTLFAVGIVIAGALAIGALMQFSAVLLVHAALVLTTAATLKYIAYVHDQVADEILVEKGLTSQKKAELFAEEFKKRIVETEILDVEASQRLDENFNHLGYFISPRFKSYLGEQPQFWIRDKDLSREVVADLVFTAYSKGIILHLDELEGTLLGSNYLLQTDWTFDNLRNKWRSESHNKKPIPEASQSAEMAARFVHRCFASGDVQVDKMNQQLNALGFKYIDNGLSANEKAKAVKPALLMHDEKTLIIRSLFGEVWDLKNIFRLLHMNEFRLEGNNLQKIKVQGDGFFLSSKPDDLEDYEEHIDKFKKEIPVTSSIEILFEHFEGHAVDNFWQEETPSAL